MATYYARNVNGNWASASSWDAASSGGAGPAGPPGSADTAIFDSGFTGNITVAAAASAAVITVQAGATGTLTYGSGQLLTTTGNVTFVAGFHLAGTGTHRLNTGTCTITSRGLSFPNLTITATSVAPTLADALAVAGTLAINYSIAFAGAYDISCDQLVLNGPGLGAALTLTLVAGQTLTVASGLVAVNPSATNLLTVRSGTASSDTFLHYNGAAADCAVARATFTDVNCAHPIDNWYGGTLTRTTGITNRTSADIGGGGGRPELRGSTL